MKLKEQYRDLDICFMNKRYIAKFIPESLYPIMVNKGLSYLFEEEVIEEIVEKPKKKKKDVTD